MIHMILVLISILMWWKPAVGASVVEESRWEHRLLAYVVTTEEQRLAIESVIKRWGPELADRDIHFVSLGGIDLEVERSLGISDGEKQMWRDLWNVDLAESRFVLIGKDGGAKAFQRGTLDLPRFFELIDRMPMRRAEMRKKSSAGPTL